MYSTEIMLQNEMITWTTVRYDKILSFSSCNYDVTGGILNQFLLYES